MSDYEDEMDVDAPSKDVQFSSENASGKKRVAADLPIQAQDNLPWYGVISHDEGEQLLTISARVEKYRPNTLEDVSGHQDILATINKFVEKNVRTIWTN